MASGILSQLSSRFSGNWTKKRVDEADAEEGKVKKKKKEKETQDLEIWVRVSEGTVSVQRSVPAEADFETLPIRGEENSGEDQASPIGLSPIFSSFRPKNSSFLSFLLAEKSCFSAPFFFIYFIDCMFSISFFALKSNVAFLDLLQKYYLFFPYAFHFL